jgi:hypothetical protein
MRGAAPLVDHHLVRIRSLTIGREPNFNNLGLISMRSEGIFTTTDLHCGVSPALTGGYGFDQCPAPFAGHLTLQIALTFPDKPVHTPR